MKQGLIGFLLLLATASPALAEGEATGNITGNVISYLSSTNETDGESTTSSLDMVTMPDVGYEASSTSGDLEVYGILRGQFLEDGSFYFLDQYITLTWPGAEFYLGHEEYMDLTHAGTQYLPVIDNSLTAGDWGLEGDENLFQVSLWGLRLRYGVNNFTDEDTEEAYSKNYSSLSYESEGDFSFALGVTAASTMVEAEQSPTLAGGELDGRAESSLWGGVAYSWGEGSSLSLNLQQGTSQSGIASQDPAVEARSILVFNQALGSGGVTLAYGATSTVDGSDSPTLATQVDLGYLYSLTDAAGLWCTYSQGTTKDEDDNLDQASGETGLGLIYSF